MDPQPHSGEGVRRRRPSVEPSIQLIVDALARDREQGGAHQQEGGLRHDREGEPDQTQPNEQTSRYQKHDAGGVRELRQMVSLDLGQFVRSSLCRWFWRL